jgi:hypothetical protein
MMTASQYLLNLGLLGYVLYSNLGTRTLTRRRFTLPLLVVAVAGYAFLRDMPTAGHDVELELAGLSAGALLAWWRRFWFGFGAAPTAASSRSPVLRSLPCGPP